MLKNPFKRVLLKISGEALACPNPLNEKKVYGISQEMLEKIALDIQEVHDLGIQVCVVVGGGNIYRGAHGATKHNIDRTTSDHMGMLATVINGLALSNALEAEGVPSRLMSAIPMNTIAQPYVRQRAIRHLEKGRVVIFVAGTGNPYFTTDTAAVLRATEMGCDVMLKSTKVDGVYDQDPFEHDDAVFYDTLTYADVLNRNLSIMDATAITLAQENQLPLRVFSIYRKNSFPDVIKNVGPFTKIS